MTWRHGGMYQVFMQGVVALTPGLALSIEERGGLGLYG